MSEQTLTRRALGGHAAIGLLAGALLYIVLLTGTLAVVTQRWARWEQPNLPETAVLTPQAAQRAVATAIADGIVGTGAGYLFLRMPSPDLPHAVLTVGEKRIVVAQDGRLAGADGAVWAEFVRELHETLHLPSTWGSILVGVLGAMMAALTLTGVVAHPRILRDAFRMRVRGDRQIAQADWHNRLGVWTLPFALAIAFTGAVLGLSAIGGSIVAKAYYGGDLMRAYAPLFGGSPPIDPRPAPVANVAGALRTLAARAPDVRPDYVTVGNPGTRGQTLRILAEHPRRLIYGETYRFDGAGRLTGTVGASDGALGKQAAASTYKLHFGNYGGPAIEIAYLLFGLSACVVTGTGMSLWLQKRRRRGAASPRLEAFWTVTVWGTPLMLVAILWLRAVVGPAAPLGMAFWGSMALLLTIGVAAPARMDARAMRLILGIAIAVTALGHALFLLPSQTAVLAIDAVLLAIAAILVREAWPFGLSRLAARRR